MNPTDAAIQNLNVALDRWCEASSDEAMSITGDAACAALDALCHCQATSRTEVADKIAVLMRYRAIVGGDYDTPAERLTSSVLGDAYLMVEQKPLFLFLHRNQVFDETAISSSA